MKGLTQLTREDVSVIVKDLSVFPSGPDFGIEKRLFHFKICVDQGHEQRAINCRTYGFSRGGCLIS